MTPSRPRVLLCLPCYRESNRLPLLLEQIGREDRRLDFAEIHLFFLDDGSGAEEQRRLEELVSKQTFTNFPVSIRLFPQNRGKGSVLRDGFLEGLEKNFDFIGFLDTDAATPFYEMIALIHTLVQTEETDAVIGSRIKCLGKRVERSFKRHLVGRVFATLLSNLFKIAVYDSQCGAKVFRSRALRDDALQICDDPRWLFDTQLIVLLHSRGARIREQMVDWSDIPGSKIHLVRDSYRMLTGLIRFRRRLSTWSTTRPFD